MYYYYYVHFTLYMYIVHYTTVMRALYMYVHTTSYKLQVTPQ